MRRWQLFLAFVGAAMSCGSATIASSAQGTASAAGGGAEAGVGGRAGAGGGGGAAGAGGAGGAGGAACSAACPTGTTCESGSCTVRYGFFSTLPNVVMANPGYQFGETISISAAITAIKLGALVTNANGAKGTLALYTDVKGSPSALVAQTPSTSINTGTNEISLPATPVAAGTYWLMGEYTTAVDVELSSCDNCQAVATATASYAAFPSKLTATTGTGSNLAYYVVGTE